MEERRDGYYINNSIKFESTCRLSNNSIEESFDFAYKMAESQGHRESRSGGTHQRKKMEIFVNAFCGKLSEFAVYEFFIAHSFSVDKPDIGIYKRGIWDTDDIIFRDSKGIPAIKATIKSTKKFGNLLLLETKDWDRDARYLPNDKLYNLFFLVRTDVDLETELKRKRSYYTNNLDFNMLTEEKEKIKLKGCQFDIPGYLFRSDVQIVIRSSQVIKRGQYINGKTKMDADNYYVQSGNMRSINDFFENK